MFYTWSNCIDIFYLYVLYTYLLHNLRRPLKVENQGTRGLHCSLDVLFVYFHMKRDMGMPEKGMLWEI